MSDESHGFEIPERWNTRAGLIAVLLDEAPHQGVPRNEELLKFAAKELARHINWQPIEGAPKNREVVATDWRTVMNVKCKPKKYQGKPIFQWENPETGYVFNPTHFCELEGPDE